MNLRKNLDTTNIKLIYPSNHILRRKNALQINDINCSLF